VRKIANRVYSATGFYTYSTACLWRSMSLLLKSMFGYYPPLI